MKIRANGDVYITELSGDLWLDELLTSGGNAWVQVQDGRLLDANLVEERDERTYAQLAGGLWKSLALIGPDADAKLQAQKDAFARGQEGEYRQYWLWRDAQLDHTTGTPVSSSSFCATCDIPLTAAEVTYYTDFYTGQGQTSQQVLDSLTTLATSRTIQYRSLHAQWDAYFIRIGVGAIPAAYPDPPGTTRRSSTSCPPRRSTTSTAASRSGPLTSC